MGPIPPRTNAESDAVFSRPNVSSTALSGSDFTAEVSTREAPMLDPSKNILTALEDHLKTSDINDLRSRIESCHVSFEHKEEIPEAQTYMRNGKEYFKLKATWDVKIQGGETFQRTAWIETDIELPKDIEKYDEQVAAAGKAKRFAKAKCHAYRAAIDPSLKDSNAVAKADFLRAGHLHVEYKEKSAFSCASFARVTFDSDKGKLIKENGEPLHLDYPYEVVAATDQVCYENLKKYAFDLSKAGVVELDFILEDEPLERVPLSLHPFIIRSDDPSSLAYKLAKAENGPPNELAKILKDNNIDPEKYAKRLLAKSKRYHDHWERKLDFLPTEQEVKRYQELVKKFTEDRSEITGESVKNALKAIGKVLFFLPLEVLVPFLGEGFISEAGKAWGNVGAEMREFKLLDAKIRYASKMSDENWAKHRQDASNIAEDARHLHQQLDAVANLCQDKANLKELRKSSGAFRSYESFQNVQQALKKDELHAALHQAETLLHQTKK